MRTLKFLFFSIFSLSVDSALANDYLAIGFIDSGYANDFSISLSNDRKRMVGSVGFSKGSYTYIPILCDSSSAAPLPGLMMEQGAVILLDKKLSFFHLDSNTYYEGYQSYMFSPNLGATPGSYGVEEDSDHLAIRYGFVYQSRSGAECPAQKSGPWGSFSTQWLNFESHMQQVLPTGKYSIDISYAIFDIWTTKRDAEIGHQVLSKKSALLPYIQKIRAVTTVDAVCSLKNPSDLLLDHGDVSLLQINGHKSNSEKIVVSCNGVTDVNLKTYFVDTNNNKVSTVNGVSLTLLIDDDVDTGTKTKTVNNIWGGEVEFYLSSVANSTGNTKPGSWDLSAIAEITYN